MKHEVYTKETLYKELASINSKFDCNKSLMVGNNILGIIDTEGNFYRVGGFHDFARVWNETFTDIIDYSLNGGSFQSGNVFYIKWKDVLEKEVNINTQVLEKELKEDALQEENFSEETVEEVGKEEKEVNWDHAESLEDKKDLEDYARCFGVELSRRKSLDNMLKDFKKAIK